MSMILLGVGDTFMHVGADEDCDGVGEHARGDDARADVRLGGARGTGETAMCALECDRGGVAEKGQPNWKSCPRCARASRQPPP
eukprot:13086929-Alexandrium_andersonii.AAC.1